MNGVPDWVANAHAQKIGRPIALGGGGQGGCIAAAVRLCQAVRGQLL